MDRLSDIINKKTQESGLAKLARPAWICYEINKKLDEGCEAVSYRDGKVTLRADDYIRASILKMNKKTLIRDFNSWIRCREIQDIKIEISKS